MPFRMGEFIRLLLSPEWRAGTGLHHQRGAMPIGHPSIRGLLLLAVGRVLARVPYPANGKMGNQKPGFPERLQIS